MSRGGILVTSLGFGQWRKDIKDGRDDKDGKETTDRSRDLAVPGVLAVLDVLVLLLRRDA